MQSTQKVRSALDQKFKDIGKAPAGFGFFVSLHDFVEYIEETPSFSIFFAGKRGNRAAEMPKKYFVLKQVYQGIEDIDAGATNDLGHDRYVAIRELSSIRNKDLSENNSFWKRREVLKKVVGEIHRTLDSYLVGPEAEVKKI